MYKYKKKKSFLGFIGIFLFVFLLIYFFNIKFSINLTNITGDIGNSVKGLFITKVNGIDSNIMDGINKNIENELNELKELNNLKTNNYNFKIATVIDRSVDWYQEIIIDKGKKDKIKEDMAVISNSGLIGRVIDVGINTSTVKLITSNNQDMKISVSVYHDNDIIHGIINSYNVNEQVLEISLLKTSSVDIGDLVYTSGLGKLYPEGIYIGKVVDITYDDLGLSKIIKVKSNNYDNIRYVYVVSR